MYKIGIDVGGMSIKAGLVVNGEIIQRSVKETNQSGGLENIIEDITELVNDLLDKSELEINNICSVGIGFPGVVTSEGRVTCVNIGLENALIIPKLEERLKGTIVRAGNDANVAALAEYFYGSMKGYNSGVMITLGTGIGGGIVIDDKLITGSNGVGAEIGHTMVATNYYDCNCGNNGCFETFCSATAIIKYTQKLLKEGRETIIRDMCKNNLENITAKMVFDAKTVSMLVKETWRTLYMVGLSSLISYLIGIPLGVALVVTDKDGIRPVPLFNKVAGVIVNLLRSVPFIILLAMVMPLTRAIVGKTIGANAAVVPLVIAAFPYISRMVEASLKEIDAGVIEAAKSMGASTWQIIFKVLLPESKPSLLVGAAISITTILGYSAMAGCVGAGGLGDVAIRYGYHRYQADMMLVTVVILVIIAQLIQEIFTRSSRRSDKRIR